MMDQRALAHELARHHGRAQYRHRCRPACASTGGAHRSVHAWLGALYVVTTTALGSALGSSIQSRTSISSFSIVLSLHSVAQRFTQSTQVCACVLVWVGACACVRVGGCVCGALCHAHPPGVYRMAVYESSQSKAVRPSTDYCSLYVILTWVIDSVVVEGMKPGARAYFFVQPTTRWPAPRRRLRPQGVSVWRQPGRTRRGGWR